MGIYPRHCSERRIIVKDVLEEDNQALDEVVVVGYGVQRKSDLTGSVASVNSDVLESRPQANLIQSLQGAVPGLNISVTGSNAEGSSNYYTYSW